MKNFSSLFIILILLCSWSVIVNAQDETVTVEVTGLPEGVQNAAFEVTITFSEAVSGFEMQPTSRSVMIVLLPALPI